MSKSKFLFGDIIVVRDIEVGVILKTWDKNMLGHFEYEIYNRITSKVELCAECDVERYRVRHKYLNDEEIYYQSN